MLKNKIVNMDTKISLIAAANQCDIKIYNQIKNLSNDILIETYLINYTEYYNYNLYLEKLLNDKNKNVNENNRKLLLNIVCRIINNNKLLTISLFKFS